MTKKEIPASLPGFWREICSIIGFCLPYIAPLLVLYSAQGGLALLAIPVTTYCLVPIADRFFGLDRRNPKPEEVKKARDNLSYQLITWLWLPVQLGLIAYGILWVLQPGRTLVEIAGMIFAIGIVNGAIGIAFAHELIHKANRFEQVLGLLLMTSVSYPHYCIEHIWGHHKNVATPDDPTTARFGEDFYSFYLRSVPAGLLSAWRIEKKRVKNHLLRNRMLWYGLGLLVVYGAIFTLCGFRGLCFFFLQGIVAFSILELTHYVEHYGLLRRQILPGKYERPLPEHSWNDWHWLTNLFILQLARHSDHHCLASKRYQLLQFLNNVPQLPYGYGTMHLIALVPPLWFKVMNPRVLQWRQRSWVEGK